MESKTCQVASCMVPKFKLKWAVEDDRINIKNTLMETILDNALTNSQENFQLTPNPTSIENHNYCDTDDDFFNFEENNVSDSNNGFKFLVENYLSNKNIKSPLDLPNTLKQLSIKYNTAVPSSAHVERLFNAGGQSFNKRRGSMADQNFEMTLLLKFNKYFE
ncbi:uncharacterized protein LOC126552854 [Aphis gossypii]|uniref:uncharacterized protein LOC126552854 n=1 Tax=Aphis gossypii TaxID=80765 RepID=UPI0021598DAD|nr:uncharacterized protein LOC126552854 [Aphis gossypii]